MIPNTASNSANLQPAINSRLISDLLNLKDEVIIVALSAVKSCFLGNIVDSY